MNKKIKFGLDGGFGHIKTAKYIENGEIDTLKFQSIVAESKGKEKYTYLLDDGKYYFVGSKALKQPKDTQIEIVDYQKLEKFIPILTLESFRLCDIEPEDISEIVTGLSISHKDSSHNFKQRLSNFVVNDIEYNFNVKLLPQGLGAVNAIKKLVKKEPNDYLVIDGGFNTIDIVTIIDKEIMENELIGYDNMGVINIAKMVQKYIKESFGKEINIKKAASILDSGEYFLRGETSDLKSVIEEFKTEYTKNLMNFLEKNYEDRIDDMEKIIFVGGGAYFIDKSYANNIAIVPNPEYYNAIGNLLS